MQTRMRWLKRAVLVIGVAGLLSMSAPPPFQADGRSVGATVAGPLHECKDTVCG